jgi:hypothetical protein
VKAEDEFGRVEVGDGNGLSTTTVSSYHKLIR